MIRNFLRAFGCEPQTPSPPDTDREGSAIEKIVAEVEAVRSAISQVVQARSAHGLVVGQRDALVQELNQSAAERAAVQAELTARERGIALSGGDLPSEPFPEEAEINLLNRHVRIRQERVRMAEAKVQESQKQLDSRVGEMEVAWAALGSATSECLLQKYRDAAEQLRDAQFEYLALSADHFSKKWNAAIWKFHDRNLTIADPKRPELILNPLFLQIAAKWPPSAQLLLKNINELRAEVDRVK